MSEAEIRGLLEQGYSIEQIQGMMGPSWLGTLSNAWSIAGWLKTVYDVHEQGKAARYARGQKWQLRRDIDDAIRQAAADGYIDESRELLDQAAQQDPEYFGKDADRGGFEKNNYDTINQAIDFNQHNKEFLERAVDRGSISEEELLPASKEARALEQIGETSPVDASGNPIIDPSTIAAATTAGAVVDAIRPDGGDATTPTAPGQPAVGPADDPAEVFKRTIAEGGSPENVLNTGGLQEVELTEENSQLADVFKNAGPGALAAATAALGKNFTVPNLIKWATGAGAAYFQREAQQDALDAAVDANRFRPYSFDSEFGNVEFDTENDRINFTNDPVLSQLRESLGAQATQRLDPNNPITVQADKIRDRSLSSITGLTDEYLDASRSLPDFARYDTDAGRLQSNIEGLRIADSEQGYLRDLINQIGSGGCLLYTSPSPRDRTRSRMPSSA